LGRPAPPGPPRSRSFSSNMRRCCLGGGRSARRT